jgi:alpha-mannosidase
VSPAPTEELQARAENPRSKEIIPYGQTGGIVVMEDNPNFWDAWDVDQFHLEKQTHLKFGNVRIAERGPVRATLGASLRVGQSTMEVEVSLLGHVDEQQAVEVGCSADE